MKSLFSIRVILSIFIMLSINSLTAQTIITVGTGTNGSSYPFYTNYNDSKTQMLYTATELNSAGSYGGQISSIAFNVTSVNTRTMNGFNIKIQQVSQTSLTSYLQNNWTSVYNSSYTVTNTGWNTFNFSSPFIWDGTSSIVVEICYNNTNYSSNSIVASSSAPGKTVHRHSDNGTGCTFSGLTSQNYRPNAQFNVSSPSSNDFAAIEFTLPVNGAAASAAMPVSIKVKNVGSSTQTVYSVKYSIDNGNSWTTKTALSALASYATANVTFVGTQTANMSSPGVYQCIGVVSRIGDTITSNDTIRTDISICSSPFSGDYIIGSDTTADFPSISSAIAAMKICGIGGAINLKLSPGNYNQQLRIGAISGITAAHPLTIESLNGDPNSVIFEYSASNINDNYVVKLDTCNYVNIKNITIKATGTLNFGRSVDMYASNNCNIEGNIIYNTNNTASNLGNYRDNIHVTSNAIFSNNTFKGNLIKNGYYGIWLNGNNSNRSYNSIIENNTFIDNANISINIAYTNSIEIKDNDISNTNTILNNPRGIYVNNGTGTQKIIRNKIVTSSGIPMQLSYMSGTSSDPVIVANNFIHQINLGNNTVHLSNNSYLNFSYNSIHTKGNNSGYNSLYVYSGTSYSFYNNIIINNAGGKAIYVNNTNYITNSNYNNFYSSGNYIAYWNGSRSSLANLQSASGKDGNSVNTNVTFYTDDNLHVVGSVLNGLGTPIAGISDDFDGETRDAVTPDIGADEFDLYPNDAGISEFINLQNGCPGTSQNISVKINNYGTSGIANVNVGWSVNGNLQTPYVWSGLLGLLNSATATIGSYTFYGDTAYEIKAWVNTVNLVVDSNAMNDTVTEIDYHTSMSGGTYQIGSSSSADYSSISSAISAMNTNGICGPIVFNLENGIYYGPYDIPYINGASATNTVTLQSLTGDSSNVKFVKNSTSSNSYIFQFNGSGYFKFKNLSFSSGTSSYSKIFSITNLSRHISIDSCSLIGGSNTSTSSYNRIIDINNSSQFSITNSVIKNGSDAIKVYGSSSNYASGIIIKNNSILNFNNSAFNATSIGDTIIIHNNIIEGNNYGIITNNSYRRVSITSNKIKILSSGNYGYGINVQSHNNNNNGANSNYSLDINNNFIDLYASVITSNSVYGLYINSSSYINIYYNTIKVRNSNNSSSTCIRLYSTSQSNLKNNIFDAGNHYALYVNNTYSLTSSNYNSFYSTATNPMYYSGSRSFASYKSYSNKDGNSKWGLPNYIANDDLHIHDVTLNNAGTVIPGITLDIDGDTRGFSGSPDIGADEFTILANDAQLYAINTPNDPTAVGSNQVRIAIRNMGTSNIILDSLHFSIDNGPVTSILWTGNIAPLAIDSMILIGSQTLTAGNHTVKAWTSYPNYAVDLNPNNDTLVKSFVAQAMPIISVNPTSISGTTTNCNDSLFIPLTIKNNGNAVLNYTLDSTNSNSTALQVLVLTYGSSYYSYLVASMGQTFTNYQSTELYTSNASILQSALVGKDVVIVPYIGSSSYASAYATFATTLQAFVNDGGIIMFAGQGYPNVITNTGLWSNYYDNGVTSNNNYLTMANHSITNNITSSDLSSNSDYYIYTNTQPSNFNTLLTYNSSYVAAGYFPYGDGTVMYLGFRYTNSSGVFASKLLSNSLKWAYDNRSGWLSSGTTSGSVNAGDSTIINVELNSLGLNNGTYISDLTISSNDFANPSVIVPCTLNVVGTPIIASNNSSVNFNSQYNNVAAYDSVQIYNSGCGDLTITGITTNNSVYSAISYDNTLSPGDSTWIVYKFLSSTAGAYAGTSTIASNAANYTVYLTGFTSSPPAMTVTPNPLNITIPNCNDSVTTNLQIQNTGGGTLTAEFASASDSAHIIVLTAGSNYTRKNNMISSFGYSFSKYDYIELNTTNATTLQNSINSTNANVIVIPEVNSSYTSSYSNLATTLQNFTNAGGTVIFGSIYYSNLFDYTGLISGSRIGQTSGNVVNTVDPNDPITENFSTVTNSGSELVLYYTFTGTGITSLQKYGTYDVSVRKEYGAGQVIVLGYRYYNMSTSYPHNKQVLSNSLKNVASGVEWLGFASTTSTLTAGSTAVKPFIFRSAGLTTGVHTTTLKITTNLPTNPIVYVPCTLTVQNQMPNGIDLGNDTTSCGPLTLDAGSGFSSYLWNTGNTTQTITAVSSGTYSVTVGNGGPCSASDAISVVVVTSASASITGLPNNTCTSDGDITLIGLPTGGVFAGPGLTGNIFNPASAGIGSHTVFYTYNGTTCSSTASQPVTVSASPAASFTGLAASYCPNDPAVGLIGTPTGGTFSGTGMISNIFYPSIAGLGSHDITYSYTNAGGCTGYDTNTVVIGNTSININIMLSNTGYCLSDAPTTLFATPAGGTFSGNGIIGNVFYPNLAGIGTHYIKYLVTSTTTCDAVDSVQVNVGATPTGLAISGLPATFCYNAADVNISTSPAGGTLSGYGITGNTFSPSLANIGVHTITYTVTNNGGCSATVTQNTEVLAPPTITFNNMQSSYCENDAPFIVTVNPVGGSLSGDALISNVFEPSLANTGSNYIYYNYTDANSCTNSDSFNIVINNSPTASITAITNNFCSTSPMESLSGAPAGGVFSGNGVIGTNFDPSIAGAGMHYVTYTYTDNNGCYGADSTTANVSAVHNVDAGSDASISYNSTSQLSGLISGGNGPFAFSWSPSTKVVNAGQLSTSTTNLTNSTAFTLSVTDNNNSCVNQDEVIITVTGGALTGVTTAFPTTVCEGETSQLQTLGSGGTNSNYIYSWSSVPVGFTSSINNPTVNPTVNTTYTCMIYSGTDSIASTVSIDVDASPNAMITNLDTLYCSNDAMVQITVTPPNGTLTGGGISGFNFIPNVAPLGNNTIIYTIIGTNGCYGADTVQVLLGATPAAFAGNDTILPCTNGGLNLGQQPINGVTYLWSPVAGLTDATIANPALSFNASMNYTLTASDDLSGCISTDNIDIQVSGAPITNTNNDTLVCANSAVTLTATGGSSYFWSNGDIGQSIVVSPMESTLYYVIVSDAGCSTIDTVWVNVSDPKPYFGADTTICASQSITLDAGAGNTSYDWSNGSTNQTVTIDSTGIGFGSITLDVDVIDNMGCIGSDTIMITFVDCTGLNNVDNENFIMSIYPNPTKGLFTISSNETSIAKLKLEVMDLNGRLVYENQLLNTRGIISEQVDLSHRAKGIYIVRLSNGSMIKTFKVVVQ